LTLFVIWVSKFSETLLCLESHVNHSLLSSIEDHLKKRRIKRCTKTCLDIIGFCIGLLGLVVVLGCSLNLIVILDINQIYGKTCPIAPQINTMISLDLFLSLVWGFGVDFCGNHIPNVNKI
jgi:hypothetical protein